MNSTEKVRFPESSAGLLRELKVRVGAHLDAQGPELRDDGRMYLKTAVILGWLLASYLLLLLVAQTWWQSALFAVSLGLAGAGVGFNVQHDASHGSYSRFRAVNWLFGHTLDLVGGSSWVWKVKHNIVHHTYTNIAHVDADIDVSSMARLAPGHEWRPMHRFQHLYIWGLYCLLPLKWHFVDDYQDLARGRIANQRFTRPSKKQIAGIVGFKLFFYAWALVLPALLHPVWAVAAVYMLATAVTGVTLAIVFQLAHCVDVADFPMPGAGARMEHDWAVHQLNTTVNFARNSRFLTWFLGGLNFQVEHHLFPKISHVHYPAVARIVEATCAEYGVRYRAFPSMSSAVRSHARWLWQMGRPVPAAP